MHFIGGTTTGFSEWDAEYLDSLDNDDDYDYSYENDVTHDDVTVLDTTTLGITTASPSGTIQDLTTASPSGTTHEATEGLDKTTSNGDVSTPYYDDTKPNNTTQQSNDSMTQISPTPERAKSADIANKTSNSNET